LEVSIQSCEWKVANWTPGHWGSYNLDMVVTTVGEMQQNLLGYLQRVEGGETVLVMQGDRLVAEMRPVQTSSTDLRPIGLCAGQFVVPEDFDRPLPDDTLSAFEGT
jgi:antitoxin (DNA-binding transcriptional repressor) of toxin-antitoxin stability system